jgi:hypothetical protein
VAIFWVIQTITVSEFGSSAELATLLTTYILRNSNAQNVEGKQLAFQLV